MPIPKTDNRNIREPRYLRIPLHILCHPDKKLILH